MFRPDIDLILEQPNGFTDGKVNYVSTSARGLLIDFSARDLDLFGSIQNGKIALIAPPVIPKLPGRIRIGEAVYDLKSIHVCRNLAGELVGCRCAVAGGA